MHAGKRRFVRIASGTRGPPSAALSPPAFLDELMTTHTSELPIGTRSYHNHALESMVEARGRFANPGAHIGRAWHDLQKVGPSSCKSVLPASAIGDARDMGAHLGRHISAMRVGGARVGVCTQFSPAEGCTREISEPWLFLSQYYASPPQANSSAGLSSVRVAAGCPIKVQCPRFPSFRSATGLSRQGREFVLHALEVHGDSGPVGHEHRQGLQPFLRWRFRWC